MASKEWMLAYLLASLAKCMEAWATEDRRRTIDEGRLTRNQVISQHGNFAVKTFFTKRFKVQAFLAGVAAVGEAAAGEAAVAEAEAVETVLGSVGSKEHWASGIHRTDA